MCKPRELLAQVCERGRGARVRDVDNDAGAVTAHVREELRWAVVHGGEAHAAHQEKGGGVRQHGLPGGMEVQEEVRGDGVHGGEVLATAHNPVPEGYGVADIQELHGNVAATVGEYDELMSAADDQDEVPEPDGQDARVQAEHDDHPGTRPGTVNDHTDVHMMV